jgi:hypothetical protein
LNYDDREVQQYLNELPDLEKQRNDGRSCFGHEHDEAGYRYSQSEKGMLEHFSQSHPDVSRWAQLRDEEYTKLLGDAYRSKEAATAEAETQLERLEYRFEEYQARAQHTESWEFESVAYEQPVPAPVDLLVVEGHPSPTHPAQANQMTWALAPDLLSENIASIWVHQAARMDAEVVFQEDDTVELKKLHEASDAMKQTTLDPADVSESVDGIVDARRRLQTLRDEFFVMQVVGGT